MTDNVMTGMLSKVGIPKDTRTPMTRSTVVVDIFVEDRKEWRKVTGNTQDTNQPWHGNREKKDWKLRFRQGKVDQA